MPFMRRFKLSHFCSPNGLRSRLLGHRRRQSAHRHLHRDCRRAEERQWTINNAGCRDQRLHQADIEHLAGGPLPSRRSMAGEGRSRAVSGALRLSWRGSLPGFFAGAATARLRCCAGDQAHIWYTARTLSTPGRRAEDQCALPRWAGAGLGRGWSGAADLGWRLIPMIRPGSSAASPSPPLPTSRALIISDRAPTSQAHQGDHAHLSQTLANMANIGRFAAGYEIAETSDRVFKPPREGAAPSGLAPTAAAPQSCSVRRRGSGALPLARILDIPRRD